MGRDTGLRVIDVRDSAEPVYMATHMTPGDARSVAIANGYAFIADSIAGLQVIRLLPALRQHPVSSSNRIRLIVPARFNPGPYHVRVTNPGGQSFTAHNAFRVRAGRGVPGGLEPRDGVREAEFVSGSTAHR